jgi:hypothetical protein
MSGLLGAILVQADNKAQVGAAISWLLGDALEPIDN